MTKDEAIKYLNEFIVLKKISNITEEKAIECFKLAVEALEQESCEDVISRAEAEAIFRNARSKLNPSDYKTADEFNTKDLMLLNAEQLIHLLPSVKPQEPKLGHCKECKYFEYDSVANVDGISLIVAHEICKRWGNGCKTKEDGYCFMFEPQEREEV